MIRLERVDIDSSTNLPPTRFQVIAHACLSLGYRVTGVQNEFLFLIHNTDVKTHALRADTHFFFR